MFVNIIRKISKIGITRCHILKLNASNSLSAWAPPQIPRWEAYSAPSDPSCRSQLYLRGLMLKGSGRQGEGNVGNGGRKGKGEGKERGWSEGIGQPKNFGAAPLPMLVPASAGAY